MAANDRVIDAAALARWQRRWAQADGAPWLHSEVARRMAERLPLVKQAPGSVLDWWSSSGGGRELLRAAYPQARIVPVEPLVARAPAKRRRWPWQRPPTVAIGPDAVEPAAAQLVWANMMLHALADPTQTLAQWRRALAADGFLMFSSLGPGTLRCLRDLYRAEGWGEPHAPFVDMHDLGDMLVHAGFADPVMDQELLRLTWATPAALLAELRTLGVNADPSRHAGWRTPRWRARLEQALTARAQADGRIALEFEVVYGHAFVAPPRVAVAAETRLGADELQRMARSGRRGASLR